LRGYQGLKVALFIAGSVPSIPILVAAFRRVRVRIAQCTFSYIPKIAEAPVTRARAVCGEGWTTIN